MEQRTQHLRVYLKVDASLVTDWMEEMKKSRCTARLSC